MFTLIFLQVISAQYTSFCQTLVKLSTNFALVEFKAMKLFPVSVHPVVHLDLDGPVDHLCLL